MYHGFFKGVSREFQGFFKGVSQVFQGCFMGVSRVFHGCFKFVSRVFQGILAHQSHLEYEGKRLWENQAHHFRDLCKDGANSGTGGK